MSEEQKEHLLGQQEKQPKWKINSQNKFGVLGIEEKYAKEIIKDKQSKAKKANKHSEEPNVI